MSHRHTPNTATTTPLERHQSSRSLNREHATGLDDNNLVPAHPRLRTIPATVSAKVWKQILGLNPFKSSYFGLYRSLKSPKDRAIVLCGTICAVLAGVPLPVIGVIFGKIISSFPPDENELHMRITELLGVAVGYFVVTTIYTLSFSLTGEKIALELRKKLLGTILRLEQAYLDTHDLDYNALLQGQIDAIQVGCSEKVGIFIQSMSYFGAAFATGFVLNAHLTGILAAAVIPTMIIVVYLGSTRISRLEKRMSHSTEQANSLVESCLRNLSIVQAFDMIDKLCEKHQIQLDSWIKESTAKSMVSAAEVATIFFIAYSLNGLAFFVGSRAGGSAGTIYAVVFLILDASFVVGQFAPFIEAFARASSSFGTLQEIFEANPEPNVGVPVTSSDSVNKTDLHGKEIQFMNVSFSFPAREAVNVLDGFDLTLHPGKLTAIVGTSGGGKSTLVSLLLRLYDYRGQINVGSDELRVLDAHRVRSQVAVVPQNCVLFSGTVFDNICYGLEGQNVPESELVSRCQDAAAAAGIDFLDDLPNGIHTRIDNQLKISGGERQRICLARALVRSPAMLILDEMTSALDAQSELKVMRAVHKAAERGILVMMIAHRLSTVLDADRIIVLSDGKVVENGPPSELSHPGTVFRGLLDAQNTTLGSNQSETDIEIPLSNDGKESAGAQAPFDGENQNEHHSDPAPTSRQIFFGLWKLTRPEHLLILGGLFASILSGSIILGEAIVFGNLVQLLNTGQNDAYFQHEADFLCLMFFVLACVALVSYACSGTAFGIASARLTGRIQATLLSSVLHLDVQWFSGSGRSAYELTSSFSKNAGDLACLSGVALGTIFTVTTSITGGIILAHIVAWKIAVVLLSAVPVMLASGYIRLRMLAKSEARQRTAYGGATALAIEICQKRTTVTLLGLEDLMFQQYKEALERPHKQGLWVSTQCNALLALSLAITYFVYALAYWWGAKQVRSGMYSQKEFFTVLPALLFSAQAAGQLFSLSPEIARARTAAACVFQLLGYQPKILQSSGARVSKPSTTSLPQAIAEKNDVIVEFKDVSFAYPTTVKQRTLSKVNFSILSGETVAFVGPSGAGKSSTIGLIERFYDPVTGQVLFQGNDIRDMDVKALRSRMALVPQEPELFPGSIEYNIRLGGSRDIVTLEQVEKAAKKCGLHSFISSLPSGYNTECGKPGSAQLSGGQVQRLSLARSEVRNPEILLLDEPTSALDAHSEREVQEALNEASQGRTTIIVAHRLASIQHADKIIVFDRGTVVEQGTHSELIHHGGLYASMAKAQSLA